MYNTPSGQLTLGDLNEVLGALHEASAKWFNIGLGLKLSVGTLDIVSADFRYVVDCLREMCSHWLRRIDPHPSWNALIRVLESPLVGERHLAQQLRDKYCRVGEEMISHNNPTPVSSSPGAPPTSQGN